MGRFKLTAKGSTYHFELQAGNYEPILQSETYESKASALNGIESVKRNAGRDGAFEIKTSKDGQSYFVLKATNGQTIGKSELYKTVAACNGGIDAVKRNASDAETVEA